MLKEQTIPYRERAIVDQFKADLPEILEGRDPYRFAIQVSDKGWPLKVAETKRCANGCDRYVFQIGLCHVCYYEQAK